MTSLPTDEEDVHAAYASRFRYGQENAAVLHAEVDRYFNTTLPAERSAAQTAYERLLARSGETGKLTDRDIATAVAATVPQDVTWRDVYNGVLEEKIEIYADRRKDDA